ncbi:MAG: beta-galactosidase [Meiothermus sp.]
MLGVCYYPEHWPRERWSEDARRMRECGITYVRIGEFAWSRIEPEPGQLEFEWLETAIETLGKEGLKIVLGTPTPTPPKWLVDKYPDILAYDRQGRVRNFGSRRHYTFSSETYRRETRRIVTAVAERFGQNPAVAGWQTDNEYGCHDTTRSYGPEDAKAFRMWLKTRYGQIDALNKAWGNIFWSMEYLDWNEIDLPNLTVTEANPAHWLDFYRFSSDQVVAYNKLQVEILRQHSPGRFIAHNFMGFVTDFDHFKVAEDLDVSSWDSYPLGFTDSAMPGLNDEERIFYARSGHPDVSAFHHDLYRGTKRRWWVMEQQPGPVNWAYHNPSPAPGMVRLWTWEALAHGAEVVSYFRWRQFPQAQEQFHAGLNRPDYAPDVGFFEAQRVAQELEKLLLPETTQAPVALVYDYEAAWLYAIQPQGYTWDYTSIALSFYHALRGLGLDVDFVKPGASLEGYKLVVVPSLPIVTDASLEMLRNAAGTVVFGPRSGSKTESVNIPDNLPPGKLEELLPLKVTRVESLRPGLVTTVTWEGQGYETSIWREWVESDKLQPSATFEDGKGAVWRSGNRHYLAFWPTKGFLTNYLGVIAQEVGLQTHTLPEGLRLRRRGNLTFAFNYTANPRPLTLPGDTQFVLGGRTVEPYGVSVWKG